MEEISNFIIENENGVLFWLTFSSFLSGLIAFLGVLGHWLYFHNDRKHQLAWVITYLITSLAFYVFASGLAYDSAIFYVRPEDYNDQIFLRVALKSLKLIASLSVMCSVSYTIYYYWRYMRIR